MGTKEYVARYSDGASIYQDCLYNFEEDDVNPNPVILEVKSPTNFSIIGQGNVDEKPFFQLSVEVPAERFDGIAIAWCKKRKLQVP